MDENTKKKKIEEEHQRISAYFENVPTNKKEVVVPLLQNASFMKVTLEELQDLINRDGVVDEYHNGATQYGTKQSATLQSYNSLVKNYASVIKALWSLLPKDEPAKGDKLEAFFNRYKDRRTKEEIEADRERVSQEAGKLLEKYPPQGA